MAGPWEQFQTSEERKLRPLAALSPAEQAASDAFERSPGNLSELRAEIDRTAPGSENRRILEDELSRQTADQSPWENFAPPAPPAGPPVPANGTNALIPMGPGEDRTPTPQPKFGIGDRIRGAIETALEAVAQATGGYADAVMAGGQRDRQGTAGADFVRRGLRFSPITGPVVAALERGGGGLGEQMSPAGRAGLETVGEVTANLPPVLGVHGTLTQAARAPRPAVVPRAVADAAVEAATPRMSPSTVERVGKAVDAGIPVSPHQLSPNKFVKILGETAENIPWAGGEKLKAARREKFSAAIAKQLDPETDVTVLNDSAFKSLQDSAGERIGEISSRYSMPIEDFGDLNVLARRDTPDVQAVIKSFADDLVEIAQQNEGVVPGDTLRKLRTEAQGRARSVRNTKPDLANALDDVVHRFDDALVKQASDVDAEALLNARRQYAISKTLEPLIARYPNGDFPPSALKSVVTNTKQGKRRMARGEAGDLGEYARIGQELLKEQASSMTAERAATYSLLVDAGKALKVGALILPAAAYNVLGPRLVAMAVKAQQRRAAGAKPAEPDLALQPYVRRPDAEPPAPGPLGDLTPDWETSPGAGGATRAAEEPGLVPALGEEPPTTGVRAGLNERAGQQIPAVPGRPDLPDTLVSGAPAETAATEAANAAMGTPGAIEARRQQSMARVERAAAAERAEPVPVGEATEIKPQNVKPAPEMPDDPIPVGEATEIVPDIVKPAPPIPEHPEVAKVKAAIKKQRDAEAKKQADADALREAAAAETDPEIKKALMARAEKIAPAKEKRDAADQELKQGSVQQERVQGDEGGQAAEAGAGDRVQRPAAGEGKAQGEESLDLGLPDLDAGFLDQQLRAQQAKAPPPTPRGRRQTRAAIEAGAADGSLDKDGAALALWALDRNPNLARGLRTEVLEGAEKAAKGAYNSAERIVKLFKSNTNPQTAMHEILHHAERMMPAEVQQGIRRAWERALKERMAGASPERQKAFEAMQRAAGGDKEALSATKQAFKDGLLEKSDYQLTNPTEFWAVNGARILHERFTGRGSWRAEARRWLKDMVEHIKGTVGLRSDAPILKALDEVLSPKRNTGADRSPTMIKDRKE